MNESGQSYEWVMLHRGMSHVTHMNESCHTREWVMALIWMIHVTHMNESCHIYEWVISHTWTTSQVRGSPAKLTCYNQTRVNGTFESTDADQVLWDMTHSSVWRDSFISVAWLVYQCDMTHPYVTWRIYMWVDSFLCYITQACITHNTCIRDMNLAIGHDIFTNDVTRE